jgi:NADH dehydrogenase
MLVENAPRVLTAYSETLSARAKRSLERLGVEVRTGTMVTDVQERGVRAGAQWIAARTVLWAAGVAASPLARSLGVPLDRAGRVAVTPELSVPGHPDAYVVGDLATLSIDGDAVPGVAPAAMQEGTHAADNIVRAARGLAPTPFRYRDRGSFAVIGRGAAVGHALGLDLSGMIAWIAWLTIHIFFLIGFRNRLAVLMNWAFSFFTLRRHAQLILGEQLDKLPRLDGKPPG